MTSKANEIDGYKWAVEHGYLESSAKLACQQPIKKLTDKFRIIPRTDSPEKHVEIGYYFNHFKYKLKWREDK